MTQILCLVNSLKHGDRCIAGIDLTTGEWVRPVSDLEDGRITASMRLIDGTEPALLDILEIPLSEASSTAQNCENRSLLPGAWKRVGQAQPSDILQYCNDSIILYNAERFVTMTHLKSIPLPQRRTIQLVYAKEFSARSHPRARGGRSWKGSLLTSTKQALTNAIITDPVLIDRLENGDVPQTPCLITISLGMPHRPADGWEGDAPCWKLIASAIDLR